MATFEETLDKAIQVAVKRAILKAHPVGSLYLSLTAENPSVSLGGGTWEKVGSGKCLWGADSSHAAGTTISAGLPNATGTFDIRSNIRPWWSVLSATGAFSQSLDGEDGGQTANGTGNAAANVVHMDLSASNPIYGNSTTVQPPAFVVNFWKRTA